MQGDEEQGAVLRGEGRVVKVTMRPPSSQHHITISTHLRYLRVYPLQPPHIPLPSPTPPHHPRYLRVLLTCIHRAIHERTPLLSRLMANDTSLFRILLSSFP